MGCNCGARAKAAQRRALGAVESTTTAPITASQPAPKTAVSDGTSAAPKAAPVNATTAGATQSYSLRLPDGRRSYYGSLLEARAAQVRSGYRGTVER